jgi:hypothetical protein
MLAVEENLKDEGMFAWIPPMELLHNGMVT